MERLESNGELHPEFSQWLQEREDFAKETLKQMKETGARGWYAPEGEQGEESTVQDPESLAPRFSRTSLLDKYKECQQGKGLSGDIVALRYQLALLEASERAFRMRHCSPVRLLTHGQIEMIPASSGRNMKRMTEYVADVLKATKKGAQNKEA